MALSNSVKEKISIEVIKTLATRFESFPKDTSGNRNAPFHDAFLEAFSDKFANKVPDVQFFISLSSWLQGLNTTLGQTFFENIAHHLCNGEKREYTSKKLGNLQITKMQRDSISHIIANLSNSTAKPDLCSENSKLFHISGSPLVNAFNFSVDVFFENQDSIVAIELKTVKPNSGEMRGEKQKILEGKAALFNRFPDKKIYFYIGFPFDPTVGPTAEKTTSYNKERFLDSIINMDNFFDPRETLLASELWDFLSGDKHTMEQILEIINTISNTSFEDELRLLMDNSKRDNPEYLAQLNKWNLFSELELLEHDELLQRNLTERLRRIFNQSIFSPQGKYNWERYNQLKLMIRQCSAR
ncbi:MAG: TdeIII family type II restriction endonuclease [Betaproteobacteria bacterium]|nr:TdeIII family type II restriction endonuclease [Betaproteobacteria bacterium]